MAVKILAAQQQTKDYKDAVELMDSSINRLKDMLTAQDAILADGQSLIHQSIKGCTGDFVSLHSGSQDPKTP